MKIRDFRSSSHRNAGRAYQDQHRAGWPKQMEQMYLQIKRVLRMAMEKRVARCANDRFRPQPKADVQYSVDSIGVFNSIGVIVPYQDLRQDWSPDRTPLGLAFQDCNRLARGVLEHFAFLSRGFNRIH